MKKITKKELRRKEKALHRNYMKEWVRKVKERDNFTCQMCGKRLGEEIKKPSGLSAAHIIPREIKGTSLDLINGITLCSRCHTWAPTSLHQNPLYFTEWFKRNKEKQYNYLMESIDIVVG